MTGNAPKWCIQFSIKKKRSWIECKVCRIEIWHNSLPSLSRENPSSEQKRFADENWAHRKAMTTVVSRKHTTRGTIGKGTSVQPLSAQNRDLRLHRTLIKTGQWIHWMTLFCAVTWLTDWLLSGRTGLPVKVTSEHMSKVSLRPHVHSHRFKWRQSKALF